MHEVLAVIGLVTGTEEETGGEIQELHGWISTAPLLGLTTGWWLRI